MKSIIYIDLCPEAVKVKLEKPAHLKGGQVVSAVYIAQVPYCMIDVYLSRKNYDKGKPFNSWYKNKRITRAVDNYWKPRVGAHRPPKQSST